MARAPLPLLVALAAAAGPGCMARLPPIPFDVGARASRSAPAAGNPVPAYGRPSPAAVSTLYGPEEALADCPDRSRWSAWAPGPDPSDGWRASIGTRGSSSSTSGAVTRASPTAGRPRHRAGGLRSGGRAVPALAAGRAGRAGTGARQAAGAGARRYPPGRVAERLVGTVRQELLDHVIVLNEPHLRRLLESFVGYYNQDRTHLGLSKDSPRSRPVECRPNPAATVVNLPRVGGLHHRYAWRTAA